MGEYDKRPREGRSGWLKFCGIGCAVFLVLVVAVGIYIYTNFADWAAESVREVAKEVVKQMDLPEEQKAGILKHVNKLADDVKAGRVTAQQVVEVLKEITDGPLIKVGMMYFVDRRHIQKSTLSDEEKQQAQLDIQRFARGIVEKKIPDSALQEAFAPLQEEGEDGGKRLKENLSPEDLRQFIAIVKDQADRAEIPLEPYSFDFAGELGKAIQRALKAERAPVE